MAIKSQKYTLSLPVQIYEELRGHAKRQDRSIREVVRQCLKFGLIAMKIDEDPNSEIVFRERVHIGEKDGSAIFETQEMRVKFLW